MAKRNRLVVQHLESVSWKVLEEYPDIIRKMIRQKSGVYALYRRHNLYYVGLANNLMGRLKQHLRDRHNGSWDRFSVYLTEHDGHMKELESLLLRIATPSGNKQTGKFARSENLHLSLNRRVKEIDDDRRALLLGGQVARRRTRAKTKRSQGKAALARVADRAIQLKAALIGVRVLRYAPYRRPHLLWGQNV